MANVSSSNGLEKRPKLRFPGFDEPWKLRKLNDMLNQRIERQIPSVDAPLMAFTAEGGVEPKGERYDRSYLVKNEDKLYKRTEYNDFIYSSNNLDVGSIGLNRYGTAVISDVYEIFSVKSDYLPTFVSELIQRPQNMKKVLKYRQGCLYGQYRIYAEDFLSVPVFVPTKQEQEKISQFLDSLDKRIAYQRSLINNLKKYKRGAVQKLFSEMDMKQWELVQLKDVVNIFDGTHQTPNYKTTGVRFISVENILNPLATQKYISEDDYQKEFKVHPEYGDVLMTRIGDIGRTCYVNFVSDMAYYVSLALFKCSSKIDGRYLAAYISTNNFQKELWERTLHIAFPKKINTGEIGECYIHLPSRERQIVIASYLDVIEKKIQLAEKQFNLMQLIKTGLMQQLFI